MTTFASDEPMGCYDDLDLGDTYFLWGANMAECHPVGFQWVMEAKERDLALISRLAQLAECHYRFVHSVRVLSSTGLVRPAHRAVTPANGPGGQRMASYRWHITCLCIRINYQELSYAFAM